ncbi:hypothetical protein GCM10011613_04230 [Cellvibrio zantedeschiae]|uniref:Circularly permuted type 2 ATP-grasp protein n=1 Tax=Cellvibrio zantedeschiae TaxID=1237077 RepID=A0ABQ3ATQ4_9GAMM|nr:hypothetical protein [Cellvibrio zantedeschiae]GGY63674.1 hypothetical protein GCM10011613_04230 [Cellvibrio zantedeschiae]
MNRDNVSGCNADCTGPAKILNHDCFCTTLNREQLDQILRADDNNQDVLASHPQLFSNTTVFISPAQLQQMRAIVQAVERVVSLPAYAEEVLARAPLIASFNPGTLGVFMGYDFHLSAQGPQIIEINTNAGGAFLNAALVSAQTECCKAAGTPLPFQKIKLDQKFISMFLNEWKLQRGDKQLTRIAIVDENPTQQFLYPEFKMAQRLFERNGIAAIIVDPGELQFNDGKLMHQGLTIDLVYNRLTDFSLVGEALSVLRQAYEAGSIVVTPNPYQYALYADKRNLIALGDAEHLEKLGADEKDIQVLSTAVPKTQAVTADNAENLWSTRKQLFFKPASGYGSRAAYRGDKLTKRVWEEILQSDYVAQQIVLPGERGILVDDEPTALKMDIRAYVYKGEIQLVAARLYQGQTTNFRTQGGGFAPVFVAQ